MISIFKLYTYSDAQQANNNGVTPLIMCSQNGHTGVGSQLLEARAAVNTADKDGDTPLILASTKGHAKLVSQLLEARALVDKAYQPKTKQCTFKR